MHFWGPATLLKRFRHRCFPVKFVKFLRTTNLKNICEGLFLNFFKKKLQHRCFFVNFLNCSRMSILKSTYERLVLKHMCGGFLFNKVASLTAWRPLTVLEIDSSAGISCEFCVIFKKVFCRTPPINHFSHDVFFFFSFLQISEVSA